MTEVLAAAGFRCKTGVETLRGGQFGDTEGVLARFVHLVGEFGDFGVDVHGAEEEFQVQVVAAGVVGVQEQEVAVVDFDGLAEDEVLEDDVDFVDFADLAGARVGFVVGGAFHLVEVVGVGRGFVDEAVGAGEEVAVGEGALGLEGGGFGRGAISFEVLHGERLDAVAVGGVLFVEVGFRRVPLVVGLRPEVERGVEVEPEVGFGNHKNIIAWWRPQKVPEAYLLTSFGKGFGDEV